MIVCMADFTEKEAEIITFGETGELRNVVEPNVKDSPNAHIAQYGEELFRILLRESDCEQMDAHVVPPTRELGHVPVEFSRPHDKRFVRPVCRMLLPQGPLVS